MAQAHYLYEISKKNYIRTHFIKNVDSEYRSSFSLVMKEIEKCSEDIFKKTNIDKIYKRIFKEKVEKYLDSDQTPSTVKSNKEI